jgi:hypothetical protein
VELGPVKIAGARFWQAVKTERQGVGETERFGKSAVDRSPDLRPLNPES